MKFYTKSGDCGMTSIVGGKRVPKTDPRISVCGEIDELNAHVGLLASLVSTTANRLTAPEAQSLAVELTAIQKHLFHIGTAISSSSPCTEIATAVEWLEQGIDRMQHVAPEVDTFVLPGGCQAAAEAHVCRTVCRRVERGIVGMSPQPVADAATKPTVDPTVTQYVNRLSDYFFALALYLNFIEGVAEKKLYIPCK